MKRYFILLHFIPILNFAQSKSITNNNDKGTFSILAMYQNGYVFQTNKFLRGSNSEKDTINAFQAAAIKFSKQTNGDNQWEQIYNYPNYGIGIYLADFYNPEEIGTPFSFFGFFNAPFKRWEKSSFNYELGFGATFNWKSFNPLTNKYNIALGAGESFLIDLGINFQYNLTNKIDLITGISLTHFSNGALKKPNYGLNTIAPKISLKYKFYNQIDFNKQEIEKYFPQNEWLITIFGGVKNVIFDSVNIDIIDKYQGVYFPVMGITTAINRQITYKSKIGLGMSLSYNGVINAQVAVDKNELEVIDQPFIDKIQISIFPSYELVINKISLIIQPAFYIYRKKLKHQTPIFYQRAGLKYHISKNFFSGLTVRIYSFEFSDFIEWNVGYKIDWR
ncbi:MAG TPA: hypothetical protein ENK91_05630 [Bacteroidetes bacterium]|nr:hypothetical protein [Bacteroidota bacterium]